MKHNFINDDIDGKFEQWKDSTLLESALCLDKEIKHSGFSPALFKTWKILIDL